MKKSSLYFACILFLVCGCKKVEEATRFEMKYDESIMVPATLGINLPFNIPTPDITSYSRSEFSMNNIQKRLVQEVMLTGLTLDLREPAYADFSFLESIRVFISTDDLPDKEIAWLDPLPDDCGDHLNLDTSGEDLKEYIKAKAFFLKVRTVTDELLTSDHYIDIHCIFFVDARILGQ